MSTEAPGPALNILTAYPYVDEKIYLALRQAAERGPVRWLVDSGAFTAWKAQKAIPLEAYCAFLSEAPIKPWRYFALDVVGNAAETRANYLTMRARGLSPVPIFTRGEALEALDFYYESSDLVAIGGLVSMTSPPKKYLKFLAGHLGARRYHLLGFTSLEWIKYLKPYSIDSSSYSAAARYGRMHIYMGRGKMREMKFAELGTMRDRSDVAARIAMLGYDIADLYDKDRWFREHALSQIITTACWIWLALELERQIGTRLFLAMSNNWLSTHFAECYTRALRAAGMLTEQVA